MRHNKSLFVAARECCVVSLVSSGLLLLSISNVYAVFLGLMLISVGFLTGAVFRLG